jgi:putative DNA primase/helicase
MVMPHAKQDDEFNPYSVAKAYREAGWLGTIPIPYNEKHPPPKGFTGAAAEYPNDAKVQSWSTAKSNIALRLAEVDFMPEASSYGANKYELIGLDVDDYGEKTGYEQMQALEEEYGPLPKTVCSSSRWHLNPNSGIRLFLVPAGYHFLGKASSAIEVIQKAHRYLVCWPSVNPDADGSRYRFRAPDGAYYDLSAEPTVPGGLAGIPPLSDVAVLPEAWFDYLTCNRMKATGQEISDLGGNELLEWASDTFNDSSGEMCLKMSNAVAKKIAELEDDHHGILIKGHWQILRLGAEGCSGWISAMKEFNNKWFQKTSKDRQVGGAVLISEIQRSVIGALSKIEPTVQEYIPEDQCGVNNVTALHDVDHWDVQMDEEEAEEDPVDDESGLGPIIRRMPKYFKDPANKYDQNDHGNAKHFIDIYQDNVKFVDSRRSWVLWDGMAWHRDIDDKLMTRAFSVVEQRQKKCARSMPRGDKSQIAKAEQYRKWALKSGNSPQIKNALSLSRTLYTEDDEPVALSGKEFDVNPKLLGCENGILVLNRDPILRPAKKEDYVTYNTHTPYIPWDTNLAHQSGVLEGYTLWQEYLDTFLPDIKLRHFIQKVMGHLLVGENPEKLLIFVYGPHDTGKSTMLGGISSALGDYYGTIDINLFNNSKLNPGLIRAVPLRVTGMSEIDMGRMDANTIKRLTGNDTVTAEAKFSNEIFEGRPQFTTIIACNHEPNIVGVDEALQERILVLPFEYQIEASKRRYDQQANIQRNSGVAVLSWLVEGWRMYCREGLKRDTWPLQVNKLCGSIVGHLNGTQTFIAECIDKTSPEALDARREAFEKANRNRRPMPNASDWEMEWTPTTAQVYELYSRWCAANGEKQISLHDLTKELGTGNPQVKNVNGKSQRCYVGFRINKMEE